MKTKNIFWAALSMTAALVMTACSEDIMMETPQALSTSKIIPYTVTVNDGATTRATVDDDNKTLKFAAGDKLYITGTNIKGVLDIQTGATTASATFSGDLAYSGSGSPASNLALKATLVSAQQTVGTQVSVDDAGAVTVNYPTTAYCTSVNDAVQKYSNLTGTSTYGAKSFTLAQQTAFLNFEITFYDGTATATSLSAKVNNNNSDICTANVTPTTESEIVVAKFVLPVAKGTTLSSATVTMGDKDAISFGASQELDGKVYNVKKTQPFTTDLSTLTASSYTVHDGETLTGTLANNVEISIAAGATVTLKDVDINGNESMSAFRSGITCLGDANLILSGTNVVKGFREHCPGIEPAGAGTTLTISGTGSLTCCAKNDNSNHTFAPGIGGRYLGPVCGNIVINGGTINASCSHYSAAIGSGSESTCGDITINGGTINATGGNFAAGIGCGYGLQGHAPNPPEDEGLDARPASCGTITITGGTVVATGGFKAPAIGAGAIGNCSGIIISGGNVTANKGDSSPYSIGRGDDSSGYNFTPTNFNVTIDGVNVGYISDSPYTYRQLLALQIGDATIYYYEGETWGDAIENHQSYNDLWAEDDGKVYYDGIPLHDGSGNPVSINAHVSDYYISSNGE